MYRSLSSLRVPGWVPQGGRHGEQPECTMLRILYYQIYLHDLVQCIIVFVHANSVSMAPFPEHVHCSLPPPLPSQTQSRPDRLRRAVYHTQHRAYHNLLNLRPMLSTATRNYLLRYSSIHSNDDGPPRASWSLVCRIWSVIARKHRSRQVTILAGVNTPPPSSSLLCDPRSAILPFVDNIRLEEGIDVNVWHESMHGHGVSQRIAQQARDMHGRSGNESRRTSVTSGWRRDSADVPHTLDRHHTAPKRNPSVM